MTETSAQLKLRPPIVVVMGHVDHGKTTLLDYIRKANVAAKEAGGITQSIGAYEIEYSSTSSGQARKITFIDTPGHEAFAKMRARGANIADLAILVVAADEGVKPQTQESIKILEEAKTPFVVAITKTDKPGANVEKVKNELTAAGVLLEGYGGEVSFEPLSAKTGEGVTELLDLVLLAAEVEHLTCSPKGPASGYILEAKVDRQRGLEATLIVKNGILKQGDPIATSTASGKVKILEDFLGKPAKLLEPSAPALIIGFETLPLVGEKFTTQGGAVFSERVPAATEPKTQVPTAGKTGEPSALRLVLKAADLGSLEALSHAIAGMVTGKPIAIVKGSVGDVGDNDVKLAISTGAVIIAFRSKTDKAARTLGEANRVKIVSSDIIYELLEATGKLLEELEKPPVIGELEVLAIFNQNNAEKQIVGGRVTSGVFRNRAAFEIRRGDETVGSGRALNLQRQKQDVSEVPAGEETGLLINSQTLTKVGDRLVIQATK